MTVVLDTGPLGLLTHPRHTAESVECKEWLRTLLSAGAHVVMPEIADYELRRELIRARSQQGLANLDALTTVLTYLPITTSAMRRAAEFWAAARQQGRPAAHDHDIDGDMVLAGQLSSMEVDDAVIATTNVKHFVPFVNAQLWKSIVDQVEEDA